MAYVTTKFCPKCHAKTTHTNNSCSLCRGRAIKKIEDAWFALSIEQKIDNINERLRNIENQTTKSRDLTYNHLVERSSISLGLQPSNCSRSLNEEETERAVKALSLTGDVQLHIVAEDPRYPTLCVNGDANFGIDLDPVSGDIIGSRACICYSKNEADCFCDLD